MRGKRKYKSVKIKHKVLQFKMATPKHRINQTEGSPLAHGLPFAITSGQSFRKHFSNVFLKQFSGLTKEKNAKVSKFV